MRIIADCRIERLTGTDGPDTALNPSDSKIAFIPEIKEIGTGDMADCKGGFALNLGLILASADWSRLKPQSFQF